MDNINFRVVCNIKRTANNILIFMVLSLSSGILYLLQIILFKDPKSTFFYLFQDLAFVPVQALVVTLVVNKILNMAERRQNLKKVNVIISAFFAELGSLIVCELSKLNDNIDDFSKVINLSDLKNINNMKKMIREFDFKINVTNHKLENLGAILIDKKPFMIGLLENSSLMEHDSFTDMLWSVFHVTDELQSRGNLEVLSQVELEHIATDILRAYKQIILEWIDYLKYLNVEYPYLFNAAVRKNPFIQKI